MSRIAPLWRQPFCATRKPVILWALFCTLALLSFSAFAVRDEATFHVSITIPSSDFYVLPINPLFLELEQVMNYNVATDRLSSLREHFDVKNVLGGINARLGFEPVLSNGRELIPLTVTFNGQDLALLDTLVVSETDAKAGKRVPLVIAAVAPEGGYQSGQYYGSVQIIFDALQP